MRIKVVSNLEHANEVRKKLKETGGYCPCVLPFAWSEDTKCICKEFRESPVGSTCHCGLYIKVED